MQHKTKPYHFHTKTPSFAKLYHKSYRFNSILHHHLMKNSLRKFVRILVLLTCTTGLKAQIAPVVPGSATIAGASVAVLSEWNSFQNLPALGHIEGIEVAVQYENRFMLKELSTKSIQAGLNVGYVNIGASFSHQGYSIYNEMLAGIGIARNFDDKFSMGVQFDYYTAYFHAADESRYRGVLLAQFGVASTILPGFTLGFHTFNPFQSNIKTEYTIKRVPSVFSIGTHYAFARNLIWLTQIDKEISSNYRFATGFEYQMVQEFTVKLGAYASDFLVPSIGFGLHLGSFHFHLNGEMHPLLGLNTLGNLRYRF